MLWAFVALASLELVGVHLLLSLWSHKAAWVMSGLTLLTVLWLIGWIRSWQRLPHELRDGTLRLNMGSRRRVDLPMASIRHISGEIAPTALAARDTLNLVPIAYPNRMIELREPLEGRSALRRIAIRVDDPAAFDASVLPLVAAEAIPL